MKIFVVFALAAAACSSGAPPDPCVNATAGMSLQGERFPDGVVLTWSGGPAVSYQIWAFAEGHLDIFKNPVVVVPQGTTAAIGLDSLFGTVEFEARPMLGATACPATPSALTVYNPPVLSAAARTDGVALTWTADPHYGAAAVIGRGPDANDVTTLATANGTSFVDAAAAPSSSFVYEVEVEAPNLKAFSPRVAVDTLLARPQVTVSELVGHIVLSWPPVPLATDCSVTATSPPGVAHSASGKSFETCPEGVVCTYAVSCSGASGRAGIPATVNGHTAPAPPFPCAATPAIGGAQIAWQAQPAAARYRIERLAGATSELIANASGTSFVDAAAPLFALVSYRLVSVAPDGVFDASAACTTAVTTTVNEPAAMNLGPSTVSVASDGSFGQTFVVAQGGQLAGIEVPGSPACIDIVTSGDPAAGPRTVCVPPAINPAGGDLVADAVHGTYFDLQGQNILVSPGETIAFEVSTIGPSPTFPATGDLIAGTATQFDGSVDAAHDLIFKAYVLPSADLPAPQLTARSGGNQTLLTWTASPGATDYEVLDANGVVLLHTNDTHATVAVQPSPGSTFSVVAIDAAGTTAASNQVTASADDQVPDAANLCLEAAGAATFNVSLEGPVQQTFTVTPGLLTGVEVAASATSRAPLPAEILDANGSVLAAFGLPFGNSFRPLSPVVAGSTAIDLSSKGIQVTAGQVLTLQLGPTVFSREGNIVFRNGPDSYAGGAQVTSDGSARDLCFKVYVAP